MDDAKLERAQTDESLRGERVRTDHALEESRKTEVRADAAVDRARHSADATVSNVRSAADQAHASGAPVLPRAVAEQRAQEDDALRRERAATNEVLGRERAEGARTLAKLLPLEREKTDRDLLVERDRSDDAIANRDDFLGMVSHDLRNLLGGIVMSAHHLSADASEREDGEQVVAQAKRIQGYAARMNRLIGDLIDVVSIDAGRLGMTFTRGNPAPVIFEAVDMLRPAASARGISLEVDVVDREGAADFDHDRLIQVLTNILSNAIKFTPKERLRRRLKPISLR